MAPSRPRPHASFWDLAYRHGDHREHWEAPTTPPEIVAAVEEGLVRAGQTALDIGCGAGAEAVFLAERGVTILGVDSSAVALELAALRAAAAGVTVDWRHGEATRLPVRDRSVDFAFDRGCLHVIGRRRRRRYAKEVARVLRPGGILLLCVALEDDEELGLVGLGRREVERLFQPRGFALVACEPSSLRARSGDLPASRIVLSLSSGSESKRRR